MSSIAKVMDHAAYPKSLKEKSFSSLQYIMKDAYDAMKAMPEGVNAGYYADEINYCGDELRKRLER